MPDPPQKSRMQKFESAWDRHFSTAIWTTATVILVGSLIFKDYDTLDGELDLGVAAPNVGGKELTGVGPTLRFQLYNTGKITLSQTDTPGLALTNFQLIDAKTGETIPMTPSDDGERAWEIDDMTNNNVDSRIIAWVGTDGKNKYKSRRAVVVKHIGICYEAALSENPQLPEAGRTLDGLDPGERLIDTQLC